MRDFLFGHTGVWNWDLWISSPALYHCTTVSFHFHLWQFEVFNSGAEGLVVVLFWLDLWEIFFLAPLGFEPGTFWISSPALYHCATVQLLIFTSDNFRYLTLVQRDWWWYCSDWTCDRFSFWPHLWIWTQDLWISSPALYHCATATSDFHLWQFQVFNSGAEALVVLLFWLDLWEIFFLATPEFEPGTSGSLILSLYHCAHRATSDFHHWQFQVFNSGAGGIGGGIVLIGPVRDFLFGHTRVWTWDLWISIPALYHCTTDNFWFSPLTIWGI